MTSELVYMKGIRKSFGSVEALQGVDFVVGHKEIVGLVGDNGAGKSTLIKIFTGVFPPDEGEIHFDGRKVCFNSPRQARQAGIETVYQGSGVVNLMSISRNFFLGREPVDRTLGSIKRLDERLMTSECNRVINEIGIKVRSPLEPTSTLSGGERQSINIGRSMYFQAKLVILDEPTTALSVKESERVLRFIRDVRDRKSASVILISHNIHHVYSVCDRFVVLNRGRVARELCREDVDADGLLEVMKAVVDGLA